MKTKRLKNVIIQFKYVEITLIFWLCSLILIIFNQNILALTLFFASYLSFLPSIKQYAQSKLLRHTSQIMIFILWLISSWNLANETIKKRDFKSFKEILFYLFCIIIIFIITVTSKTDNEKKLSNLRKQQESLLNKIDSFKASPFKWYWHDESICNAHGINLNEFTDNMFPTINRHEITKLKEKSNLINRYPINNKIILRLPNISSDLKPLFHLIKVNKAILVNKDPYINITKIHNIKSTKSYINNCLLSYLNGKSLDLIITYNKNIIGMINLSKFQSYTAQITYWTKLSHKQKEIIKIAIKGICNLGFKNYNLNKIIINAYNSSMNNIAKENGFHLDGILRDYQISNNKLCNANHWTLLKSEWNTTQQN